MDPETVYVDGIRVSQLECGYSYVHITCAGCVPCVTFRRSGGASPFHSVWMESRSATERSAVLDTPRKSGNKP